MKIKARLRLQIGILVEMQINCKDVHGSIMISLRCFNQDRKHVRMIKVCLVFELVNRNIRAPRENRMTVCFEKAKVHPGT